MDEHKNKTKDNEENKEDAKKPENGMTQGHSRGGEQEVVSDNRSADNDPDKTNHGQASFRTGSTTQGGSNFGQGSGQLGGESYHQGDAKNSGSSYENESDQPEENS